MRINRLLSDAQQIEATFTLDDALQFDESTVLYAVHGDAVVAAGLVESMAQSGDKVSVTARGLTSITQELPWTAAPESHVQINTAAVWDKLWNHVQSQPGGNLGLTWNDFTTAAWMGSSDQPFVLSPSETRDLGQVLDAIVADGVEFREGHAFDGNGFRHWLDVGTRIGDDKTGLIFQIGLNVITDVEVDDRAQDHPTGMLIIGPERQDANNNALPPFWGVYHDPTATGVRRIASYIDNAVTSNADAVARAQARLAKFRRVATAFKFTVRDSDVTPLTSFDVGDTIEIGGRHRWDQYVTETVRVTSIEYNPAESSAEVEVIPQ